MVEDAVICAQAVDQIYVVSVQSADAKCIGERCYVHAILKFPFMPAFLRVSSLRCYLQIVFQSFSTTNGSILQSLYGNCCRIP